MYIIINVHSMYILSTFNNLQDVHLKKNNVHFNVHVNYIRKSIRCTFNVPPLCIKYTLQ